jgi:hypothetical protein
MSVRCARGARKSGVRRARPTPGSSPRPCRRLSSSGPATWARVLGVFMTSEAFFLGCRGPEAAAPLRTADQHETPKVASGDAAGSLPDSAVTIHDGEEYSFSIPRRARICILYPASMFDSATCPPGAKPPDSVPRDNPRTIAVALVNIHDWGSGKSALLVSALTKRSRPLQPDHGIAEAFAAGMMAEVHKTVPGGRVRPDTRSVDLVTLHRRTLARISFDVDGATGPYELYQHSVSYSVWATEGCYTTAFYTVGSDAAAIDALAEEVAGTIRLAHMAPERP